MGFAEGVSIAAPPIPPLGEGRTSVQEKWFVFFFFYQFFSFINVKTLPFFNSCVTSAAYLKEPIHVLDRNNFHTSAVLWPSPFLVVELLRAITYHPSLTTNLVTNTIILSSPHSLLANITKTPCQVYKLGRTIAATVQAAII